MAGGEVGPAPRCLLLALVLPPAACPGPAGPLQQWPEVRWPPLAAPKYIQPRVGFFEPKHSPHLELQSKVSPPKKCRFFALGVCDSKLQLGFSLAQGRQKL